MLCPIHESCWPLSPLLHVFGSCTKSECNWAPLALWKPPMIIFLCVTLGHSTFLVLFGVLPGRSWTYFIFTKADCSNLNHKKNNWPKGLVIWKMIPYFLLFFFCSLDIFIYPNCIWRNTERNYVLSHAWRKIKMCETHGHSHPLYVNFKAQPLRDEGWEGEGNYSGSSVTKTFCPFSSGKIKRISFHERLLSTD